MNLTDAQRLAIERRGETLVSAGAGAGKTSVLVERYLGLLAEDETLTTRDLLAITFTDKAAAQMRERVRSRMGELTATGDLTPALPDRWRLEDAWIGTFHATAQRILRRYALAAGLDPDLEVLDESGAAELRSEAFDVALAGWMRDPRLEPATSEDAARALDLAARTGVTPLREETLGLLAQRRSQGRDPATSAGRALPEPPDEQLRTGPAIERLTRAIAPARDALTNATSTAASIGQGLDALPAIEAALAAPGDAEVHSALRAVLMPRRQAAVMKTPELVELFVARDDLLCLLHAASLAPAAAVELRLRERLLVRCAVEYRRAKTRRGLLDFDDLLLELRDLLRDRKDVAARLRARFRHVLVDEFQDTNAVQVELIELLAPREGLFQVGDRLQAIYGFRHATVAGFDAAGVRAGEEGSLALDECFRCPTDVLAVANHVGVQAHRGYQSLVGGHDRPPLDRRGAPAVELHVLAQRREDTASQSEPEADDDAPVDRDEAGHVAGLVSELVAAGRQLAQIGVLVRRTAPVQGLEAALLARGVDAVPVAGAPLLEALEVRELEAWLGAVANPFDDVALLGALRLPTAGVDADALVPLAAAHRAARDRARAARDGLTHGAAGPTPAHTLWDTLADLDALALPAPLPESARDALETQIVSLWRDRALARRAGPTELLARVVADDAFRAAVLERPGGPRRWAGVTAFLDWVESREAAGDDLVGLLRRIAADRGAGPPAPVIADADAVQITTVHRAKGLEWPVVICCDLGSRIRTGHPGVLLDPDPDGHRIGVRVGRGDGRVGLWDYDELADLAGREQAEEERRLVHVAVTRAQERLILCGRWPEGRDGKPGAYRPTGRLDPACVRDLGGPEGHNVKPATEPLRWLLPLLAPPDAWPAVGEEVTLSVPASAGSPPSADTPEAEVRMLVVDPRQTPTAPDAIHGASSVAITTVTEAVGAEGARPAEPARYATEAGEAEHPGAEVGGAPYPLASPVSFSALAARLGVELDPADRGPAPDADHDPPAPASEVDPADGLRFGGTRRGDLVHRVLEVRLAGEDPPAARGEVTVDEVRAAIARLEPGPPAGPGEAEDLAATVTALEGSAVAREALAVAADRRHLERPLLFGVGDDLPLVQGLVDLWLTLDDDAVRIVDWKTNRLAAGVTPDAVVEEHYALQRCVYALAALLAGHPAVEVVFVFSAVPDAPVRRRFARRDREGLRGELVDRIRTAERTPPADG